MTLTPRLGSRPATSDEGFAPELWGQLVHTAATSLDTELPLEPVHLHGVTDTSLHLCLPRERAAELAIVLGLIEESLAFARSGSADA